MRSVKGLLLVLCLVGMAQASDGLPNGYWQQFVATLRAYAPWLFGGAVLGAGAGAGASHFTGTPWGPSLVIGTSAGLALGGLGKEVYPRMWREISGQRIPLNAAPLIQTRAVVADQQKKIELMYTKHLQDLRNDKKLEELQRVFEMGAQKWWDTEGSRSRIPNANE